MTGRERAIVVGGGITGIAAAQVLAERFAQVLVIERDATTSPRPHVPHQPHTHIVGAHGHALLCKLFPGLDERLGAATAPRFDFGESAFFAGVWAPRGPFGMFSRSYTRALLERELRAILATRANVELACEQRVMTVELADGRATGVTLEDGRTLAADFVVDAAGMASRTPQLLASLGYGVPPRSEVDLRGAALTQLYRPRPDAADWTLLSVRPSGAELRCGAISHVEDGLWRVSVWGFDRWKPSREPGAQLAFARAFATPRFAEALEGAEPVSPPYYYANAASRWLHYEALDAMPDAFAVIGDATFRPNFDHSQGMTFVAMAIELLAEHLDHHELGARRGSTLAYQRAYAARMAPWWEWNTAIEANVPDVEIQPAPTPEARQRMAAYRWLRRAALHDVALWRTVLEANQGARLPATILTPEAYERAARIVPRPPDLNAPGW